MNIKAELIKPISERTPEGQYRYAQALAYSWGRNDAGETDMVNFMKLAGIEYDPHMVFAAWAASQADAYAEGRATYLPPVHDQFKAFTLAAGVAFAGRPIGPVLEAFIEHVSGASGKEEDGKQTQPEPAPSEAGQASVEPPASG